MASNEGRATVGSGLAVLTAFVVVALVNGLDVLTRALGPRGVSTRLLHLAVDFGQTLAVGLVVAGAVELWRRRGPKGALHASIAVFAVSITLAELVLRNDVDGVVARLLGEDRDLELGDAVAAALVSLTVPAALVVGRRWARPRLRVLPLVASVVVIHLNALVLVNGYPGVHLFIAAVGATLFASAFTGTALGPRAERFVTLMKLSPVLGVVVLGAAASVVVSPPRPVRAELLERDTALLARYLKSDAPGRRRKVAIPRHLRPWFESRTIRADVLPSDARLAPENPIVLLITIDALRMELLTPEHRAVAPNLQGLAAQSVSFRQARSFGSDTRFSLGALFTGRYLSQTKWTWRSRLRPTLEDDLELRLPELIKRGRIRTVTGISLPNMLVSRIGIVRGFQEQYVKREDDGKPGTEEVIDHAIERLKRQDGKSLFYFTHLIDPHAPYYRHGKKKPPTEYEAYLGEVTFADLHLGRLMRAITELGLEERTVLIVTSDHGEAFGEHGLLRHNKPLYEVMVHVPMLVRVPGVSPKAIDAHVSLMDIGPTVLDLFGLSTPGNFMGESLVPLLAGEPPPPHRPIFMERPTDMALLFADGIKVLLRTRPDSEEIYDVLRDPDEEEDLRESLGDEGDHRVALTRAYHAAHRTRNGGVR